MNLPDQLPMGFGLALLQNKKALERFYSMTKAQQNEIIAQAGLVQSKQDMLSFVDGI